MHGTYIEFSPRPAGLIAAAVDYARELLRNRKVTRPVFDRATRSFGRRGTLSPTSLISCYAMLAYDMNACELEAPFLPPREQLTPEALAAFHKSEIDKWWPLIKAANIKVE